MYRRIISVILICMMLGGLVYHAFPDLHGEKGDSVIQTVDNSNGNEVPDDTIVIWYTDESLKDYISDAALVYRQRTGKDVMMKLVPGVDYIEAINNASINDDSQIPAPDLYIVTHDNLMKAYLAGLAAPINDVNETVVENNFPGTALKAISCDSKYVAYPLYYETNFFLYNKTYMATIAQNRIESESDQAEGQAAEAEAEANTPEADSYKADSKADAEKDSKAANDESATSDENAAGDENAVSDENADTNAEGEAEGEMGEPYGDEDQVADQEVLDKLATMIPSKISDITTFANNYDAPEAVEAVFKWDVTDIFYNYFFVGNYLEVGGDNGDNNAIFNLYNQQAVECLQRFQDMNQYFTIESTDNYDSILNQFIDGKLVFTIATSDAFAKIAQAQAEGRFDFDYGVAIIPDVSDVLFSRGLSVTDTIAINGYSTKKEDANEFASILSYDQADSLYTKAGKLACKRDVPYENPEISNVMTEYQKSMPLPKMIETSNYWLQLETVFTRVWAGEDPDTVLRELADEMVGQIDEITYSIPIQESITAGVPDSIE